MYKFEISLLAVDLNFFYGKNNEWVVKELAVADCQPNSGSSFHFKSPYVWTKHSPVHTKMNSELEHGNNWNDGYILYSELKNLLK
jgi:hypothetical protein